MMLQRKAVEKRYYSAAHAMLLKTKRKGDSRNASNITHDFPGP
jgi:hypothetical protein